MLMKHEVDMYLLIIIYFMLTVMINTEAVLTSNSINGDLFQAGFIYAQREGACTW